MTLTDDEIKSSLAEDDSASNLYRLASLPHFIHPNTLAELLPTPTTPHTVRRRIKILLAKDPTLPPLPTRQPGRTPEPPSLTPIQDAAELAALTGTFPTSRLPIIPTEDLPPFEPEFQKPYRTNVNDPFTKGW